MEPTKALRGKAALVTGSSRGIGQALAYALAAQGMEVFCTARDRTRLAELVDSIGQSGGSATAIPADISTEEGVSGIFAHIRERVAHLDVCINNAGIGLFDHVKDIRGEDLDRMYATNVRGCFLCCREAMNMMIPARKGGYIINISSVVGFKGYKNQAGYGATKHAIMGLTKSLAAEAQEHGIRVSAICPGGVATEMVQQSRPDIDPNDLLHPDDITQTVLYLLSLSDRAAVDSIYIRRRNSAPF